MKHRNDAGFTLVEVMVAIVIVGLITVPMTSGLVLGMKTLARAEQMMESQLAVSSAVEKLMATGIKHDTPNPSDDQITVEWEIVIKDGVELPYYDVTVRSNDGYVVVDTFIRKAGDG